MKFYRLLLFIGIFVAVILVAKPVMAATDTDGDGLSDDDEIAIYHTDPSKADTDGDGFADGAEVYHGYSPRDDGKIKLAGIDSDNDGAVDSWEIRLGLNILNPDTDGDGYFDGQEINNGFDPKSAAPTRAEKKINVTLKDQQLAYSFGGVELEKFAISGGIASMPSPTGDFTVLDKVPSKNYGGTGYRFYFPNTKWNLHFTTKKYRYYIHGAYWHNNFGRPMSHGCINVRYDQMERLYNFAEVGTKITIS
ncbi:MAG: L,D-transpeptidase family protein [Patescibacteria group bacterium]|nr:L,D-transpeptidase family protein [Patescibacteria group bacterium]